MKSGMYVVRLEGVEPPTYSSVGCRSIQLSYRRVSRRRDPSFRKTKGRIHTTREMTEPYNDLEVPSSAKDGNPIVLKVALTGIEPVFQP